jgi:hypothetical protein
LCACLWTGKTVETAKTLRLSMWMRWSSRWRHWSHVLWTGATGKMRRPWIWMPWQLRRRRWSRDGKDGASVAELLPVIHGEVLKVVSEMPAPKDGRDGKDGKDGAAGRDGVDGAQGPQGERGECGEPGEQGRDGIDGKDGLDGVGFEDADLVIDDTRKAVILRFTKGERVLEKVLPIPMDAGVYADATTYHKGHMVSRGGSMWLCTLDTVKAVKPDNTPEGMKAWRLVAQRGKEGKQGPPGPRGKDLRWEDRDE